MNIKWIFKKMLLPIIFAIVAFFLVSHDQFLYEAPVGKITVAKMISSHEVSDDFQNKDRQVTQELSIKVLNAKGAEPGNLNLKNTTTLSQTTGQIYRVGQQVILKKISGNYQIVTPRAYYAAKQLGVVNRTDFMRIATSEATTAKMKRDLDLLRTWQVDGTPTLVVDGKYRVTTVRSHAEMLAVALWLARRELAGK